MCCGPRRNAQRQREQEQDRATGKVIRFHGTLSAQSEGRFDQLTGVYVMGRDAPRPLTLDRGLRARQGIRSSSNSRTRSARLLPDTSSDLVLLDEGVHGKRCDGFTDHLERQVFEPLEANARLPHVVSLSGGLVRLLEVGAPPLLGVDADRYTAMWFFCDASAAYINGCLL